MRALLFLALLPGCSGFLQLKPKDDPRWPLTCVSRCGARLYAQPGVYRGDCADFDAAEARAVEAFSPHVKNVCDRLRGVIVTVRPVDAWDDAYGRHVAGITRCNYRSIQVGPAPWPMGAWAHEVLHLLDCPKENIEHLGWDVWQWGAIDRANAAGVVP